MGQYSCYSVLTHWCTVKSRPVIHDVCQWSRDPPSSVSCLTPPLYLLQFAVYLPVSPSPPPITRWCPAAVSTSPALRSVPPCLSSSGWAARWSWPGRRRCRLAETCWSSLTSASLQTTPVWPSPPWAWSRPPPRSLSKVRNLDQYLNVWIILWWQIQRFVFDCICLSRAYYEMIFVLGNASFNVLVLF